MGREVDHSLRCPNCGEPGCRWDELSQSRYIRCPVCDDGKPSKTFTLTEDDLDKFWDDLVEDTKPLGKPLPWSQD